MNDEPNKPHLPDEGESATPESTDAPGAKPPASRADVKEPSPGYQMSDAGTLPAPRDEQEEPPTPESQAALTGKAPSGSSTTGTTVPAEASDTQTGDAGAANIAGGLLSGDKFSRSKAPAADPAKPAASAAPANETPEEKKARLERIIAEAKAKKEAAAQAAEAQAEGAPAESTPLAGKGGDREAQAHSASEPPGGRSPSIGDPVKSPPQADLEKAARIAEAKARAAAAREAAAAKSPPAPGAAGGAAAAGAPKAPVKKKEEGPQPTDASTHPLVQRLRDALGGAVAAAFSFLGQLSIHVERARILDVCRFLRDDEMARFNYLSDATCVHYPDRAETPFEVVYNLLSIDRNERVRLKVQADETEGIDSVTGVWPAANWMEREIFDLFGVPFRNHPDLRRLLLPHDWEGHPFRKEYPLHFVENNWTTRHLPEFTDVQKEQLEQRRAYGLEILSVPDERRIREIFRAGREPLPLDRK